MAGRFLRRQLEVAGQEHAGERFARALDQLGSEQLDVRLGGIYGLERIAARASGEVTAVGSVYRPPPSGEGRRCSGRPRTGSRCSRSCPPRSGRPRTARRSGPPERCRPASRT